MNSLLLISAAVTSYMCVVNGQSQCRQGNNCISVRLCQTYLPLLQKQQTPAELQILRGAFCGYEGNTPKVCCPEFPCLTPNGEGGACVGARSCPHVASILTRLTNKQSDYAYVQSLRCRGREQYSVCCAVSPSTPTPPTPAPQPAYPQGACAPSAAPADPATECCGRETGGDNRIVGGNTTSIDQYPWLTLIEYRGKEGRIKLLCGGVLISGKYVLTAGHCVTGPVLYSGEPVNVRLGEYDTSNPGNDCVRVAGDGQDCTEGTVIIPIETVTAHPQYDPASKLRRHDIALIRMRRLAPYTDFIRPICLPAADITAAAPAGLTFLVAGWGAVDTETSSSKVKLHVDLPYQAFEQCQPQYSVNRRRVPLWRGQLCAGGVRGKDSCKGDSGGPLMYNNEMYFDVVGIVSFGPTPCGEENVPGVYTKVFEYLPWIRSLIHS